MIFTDLISLILGHNKNLHILLYILVSIPTLATSPKIKLIRSIIDLLKFHLYFSRDIAPV